MNENYFKTLSTALKKAHIASPTLILDRERLKTNITLMRQSLPDGMSYRIVAKSLPCEALLREIRSETKTNRLMVFNLDTLERLCQIMPDSDLLLGKPQPAELVSDFLSRHQITSPLPFIQWLVDDLARLDQYQIIARKTQQKLNINLELDVGLHRGGFTNPQDIDQALKRIRESDYLQFTGFMGYEPHLANLPETEGWRERAKLAAWQIYQHAIKCAEKAGYDKNQILRNAAGSPTYRLYHNTTIANEVSVGSVLVKPTDFDSDLLEDHLPASFIATPVLKIYKGIHVPGLEFAPRPTNLKIPENKNTLFIYGGKWMAKPYFPKGLAYSEIFGRSSNQEMLEAPADLNLAKDDFIFFRPTQSEAVFTYFGDIAIYENNTITDFWQCFPARP